MGDQDEMELTSSSVSHTTLPLSNLSREIFTDYTQAPLTVLCDFACFPSCPHPQPPRVPRCYLSATLVLRCSGRRQGFPVTLNLLASFISDFSCCGARKEGNFCVSITKRELEPQLGLGITSSTVIKVVPNGLKSAYAIEDRAE